MAQQSIIYPSEPILIVDRQFRRKKNRAADIPTFSVNSGKRDVTISVFGGRSTGSHGISTTQARTVAHGLQPSSASVNFQFVEANQHLSATRAKKRRPPKRKADHENGLAANSKQHVSDSLSASSSDSASRDEDYLPTTTTLQLGGLVPRSSTTFYGYAGNHIGANAQDLLNYYTVGIARTFYPLQGIVAFDINPVKAAWMPAATDDESLLNSVLLCSEVHRHGPYTKTGAGYSSHYYRQAITHVNKRLAAGEVCDAVIGAVSCLTLIEHYLSNFSQSAIHRTGMGEMVRVRGGIQAVRKPLQMKIYRADLLPAVDRLATPKLPRLRPTTPSLQAMVLPNAPPDTDLSDALVATGMSLYVIDIMLAMSAFSNSLEYAIERELTIPSRCFDEETMGIQYDLLVMQKHTASEIDVACRSAALMYMKSLTREDPCNFDAIVDPLVNSLENIRITSSNAGLLFWISLMGAMTAQNITKRIWFREQLAVHREFLSLIDWNDAEALLHEFSWIPRIHGKTGRLVWDVIETKSPSSIFTQKLTPPLTPPPFT